MIDWGALMAAGALVTIAVAAIVVGAVKGLQYAGIIRAGKDYEGDTASEKAAVAWRGEAEAREAQVRRQDDEINRLTKQVAECMTQMTQMRGEIAELREQRDALLSRPDYGVLLERFARVEEAIAGQIEVQTATLTLLKAHDELALQSSERMGPSEPSP